jgi:hypothetical protein
LNFDEKFATHLLIQDNQEDLNSSKSLNVYRKTLPKFEGSKTEFISLEYADDIYDTDFGYEFLTYH